MAITIVTTVSGASSNSYVTLAEADAYFEAVLSFTSTWTTLTDAQKNARIVEAARAIDRLSFTGDPYKSTQAMAFPRDTQDTVTEIPQVVKDAQCEMIIYLYNARSATDGTIEREIQKLSIDGVLSLEYGDDASTQQDSSAGGTLESVKALLREYRSGDNNFRWVK